MNSVAFEQAKKEYDRVFPLILNTNKTSSKLDYLIEFLNNETLPKILILIYVIFLIKITIIDPLKLIIVFCRTLKKKKKYRNKFVEENSKEFLSYEIFDANEPYESNHNISSELNEEINFNPKISTVSVENSQEIESENSIETNSIKIESLKSSLKSNPDGSSTLSNRNSISNDKIYNKELNDLAELYADFCAYLEINYKNPYIPSSRHFLAWLYIKKKADREIDSIKRKKFSIYQY